MTAIDHDQLLPIKPWTEIVHQSEIALAPETETDLGTADLLEDNWPTADHLIANYQEPPTEDVLKTKNILTIIPLQSRTR